MLTSRSPSRRRPLRWASCPAPCGSPAAFGRAPGVARLVQGETSQGQAREPLHRTTAGSIPLRLGHESFAVSCLLALPSSASYPVYSPHPWGSPFGPACGCSKSFPTILSVRRLAVYAPRFLPMVGRPSAVVLRFTHRDQLVSGLAPAGVRPYRAHHRKAGLRRLFSISRSFG